MDMWTSSARLLSATLVLAAICGAAELRLLPEYVRPDPFGGIVKPDRLQGSTAEPAVSVVGARGGYVSVQVVVVNKVPGVFAISVDSALPVDVFREWFHLNKSDGHYYPDALIPVDLPIPVRFPDMESRISNQAVQAFWLDFWIAPETLPGAYLATVTLSSGGSPAQSIQTSIKVTNAVIPLGDPVTLDSNSYGTSWMFDQYPKTLASGTEGDLFHLIHAYHRIFYEHRSTFHQLGYGHAGKVGPEFAPELTGSGRNKRISSWSRFDQHYGPLLSGSAFQGSRQGPRPIPFVYLPVNPEWPASQLWWGEPGYEAEFINVVSEMEKHFREKGWTNTNFELFFNHKKRYKGFSWDGDEIRFERDNQNLTLFRNLLTKAIPKDSPVRFVMRADTSWSMADQFERLSGVVNFWVAGEGILSWYPEQVATLRARGDTVWSYGGTPGVDHVSSEITLNPLRSWIAGTQGFVRWQTVAPGSDPWYSFEGGGETLVYPGERFQINGPLPSIRLKLQRNCLQDLALLEKAAVSGDGQVLQGEVVRRYNGSTLRDWRNSPPALAKTPVLEWDNLSIEESLKPFEARFANLRPDAWKQVHDMAVAAGEQR